MQIQGTPRQDAAGASASPGGGRTIDEELLARVARRPCTVLIQGETGSGKEVTARRIHALSPRAGGPFVAVDCTGLRDELMESQLFGHERGAFTGAERATLGFIRTADGGTLFLDEIGELSLALQAKLLRTIQERYVVPLGSARPIPVDVRVVCATHRDLRAMVDAGSFREDLYFRLDVVRLEVPPLRSRLEEIPALVQAFLEELAEQYREPAAALSEEALSRLMSHAWPGNVRELRNAIEYAYVFAEDGRIDAANLPAHIGRSEALVEVNLNPVPTLEQAERALIAEALDRADGNKSRAAAWLDIDRRRLHRKISAYGIGASEQ